MNLKEARKLLARYRKRRATPAENAKLEAWFDRFSETNNWEWKETDKAAFREKIKHGIDSRINPPRTARLINLKFIGLAASLLLVSGLLLFVLRQKTGQAPDTDAMAYTETYAAPGHRVKVTLSDGSTVLLNGSSRLRYPLSFNKSSREVTLIEGEAYFDIRHNDKKMFVVEALGTHTYVLGTAFNIRAYSGASEVQVTVTRGKVAVKGKSNLTNTISAAPVTLLPNDQATIVKTTGNITQRHINAADYTVWVQGKYKFNNESLNNVAIALENAFNVQISFADDDIKNIRFSSEFESTDKLEDLLFAICKANKLTFTVSGRDVLLDKKYNHK